MTSQATYQSTRAQPKVSQTIYSDGGQKPMGKDEIMLLIVFRSLEIKTLNYM